LRLAAITGPLAGTMLAVEDGLAFGSLDVASDRGRPDRGCRLRSTEEGGFTLQALDRQTPVFVNGLPPTSRPLHPGDEIRVGDSLFVVRPDDAAAPKAARLVPCHARLAAGGRCDVVREVQLDDALFQADHSNGARAARDLTALLRIAGALCTVQGLAEVDSALAGLVMDVVPAERVALLSVDEGAPAVQSAWSASIPDAAMTIDAGCIGRAAAEGVALVVTTGDGDARREAIAAPMMAFGRKAGAIWIDAPAGVRTDAEQVRLLLAVAALAAKAREESREAERLHQANELLHAEINLEHNMAGRSRPMRALFDRIGRVARVEATILLRGESGTGKELVARAVHRNSARAERAFVAINCAALTETLLESELFGHEKGAFTGAIGLKKGKLELADGGTLFLDEIGELPLTLQAKLLRALQEREFERVGGTRPVRVDFRLIAATNRDLEAAVKAGAFRQDLFYRLSVVTLSLPPLRERKEDIPVLAAYFLRKHAPRCGRRVGTIAPDALALLERHDWPGNVRELENVIEQALVLGAGERITATDLPSSLAAPAARGGGGAMDYHQAVEDLKRDLIVRAFERAGRSHAAAARLLGVHPNYLHRLVRNLNLKSALGKPD
jgi:transcriptional regulator with GAF, ATPase, and Fis domain